MKHVFADSVWLLLRRRKYWKHCATGLVHIASIFCRLRLALYVASLQHYTRAFSECQVSYPISVSLWNHTLDNTEVVCFFAARRPSRKANPPRQKSRAEKPSSFLSSARSQQAKRVRVHAFTFCFSKELESIQSAPITPCGTASVVELLRSPSDDEHLSALSYLVCLDVY